MGWSGYHGWEAKDYVGQGHWTKTLGSPRGDSRDGPPAYLPNMPPYVDQLDTLDKLQGPQALEKCSIQGPVRWSLKAFPTPTLCRER